MPHLLVAGHFGAGNLGDDAILLGFASGLNSGEFDMTVMSGSPEETFRNFGFRSIPRKDMAAFEKALPSCDALVFAGGSIFQDVTSVKSVGFYSQLVAKAKKAGKKVIMLGQGVGPLNTFFGKRWATAAYNCSEAIVVRDAASISTLKSLGVKAPIRLGADMAFLLPEPQGNEDAQGFNVGDMKTVGIAPRPWGKDKKFVVSLFAEVAKLLFQAKMMPVLIEMDREHDHQLILEISKVHGGKIPDMRKMGTPMQIQQRMSRMDAVIAMRLHAGILATSVGVPPYMISYDPKVAAFAKALDLSGSTSIDNLTPQRLFENFQTFYKDKERNTRLLQKKSQEFKEQAEVNLQVLRDSLRVAAPKS